MSTEKAVAALKLFDQVYGKSIHPNAGIMHKTLLRIRIQLFKHYVANSGEHFTDGIQGYVARAITTHPGMSPAEKAAAINDNITERGQILGWAIDPSIPWEDQLKRMRSVPNAVFLSFFKKLSVVIYNPSVKLLGTVDQSAYFRDMSRVMNAMIGNSSPGRELVDAYKNFLTGARAVDYWSWWGQIQSMGDYMFDLVPTSDKHKFKLKADTSVPILSDTIQRLMNDSSLNISSSPNTFEIHGTDTARIGRLNRAIEEISRAQVADIAVG